MHPIEKSASPFNQHDCYHPLKAADRLSRIDADSDGDVVDQELTLPALACRWQDRRAAGGRGCHWKRGLGNRVDSRFLLPVSERGQGAAWGFAADTDRNDPNANQSKVKATYAKEKSRMIAIRLSSTAAITRSRREIVNFQFARLRDSGGLHCVRPSWA